MKLCWITIAVIKIGADQRAFNPLKSITLSLIFIKSPYLYTTVACKKKRWTELGKTNANADADITTLFGSKSSLVIFAVVIVVILVAFFAVKTYQALSGETIVIENEEDLVRVEQTMETRVQSLEQDQAKIESFIAAGGV